MALSAAIALGCAAAVAMPLLARGSPDMLGGVLAGTPLRVPGMDFTLHWSWPVFCVVTLLAWGLLRAAQSR